MSSDPGPSASGQLASTGGVDCYHLTEPLKFQGVNEMASFLRMTREEYENWKSEDCWAPDWVEIYKNVIEPCNESARIANRPPQRDIDMKKVQAHIIPNESHGVRKFSCRHPKTQDFSKLDWYAYVLHNLVKDNSALFKGLFFNKGHMTLHNKQCCIWTILHYEAYEHGIGRASRRQQAAEKEKVKQKRKVSPKSSATSTTKRQKRLFPSNNFTKQGKETVSPDRGSRPPSSEDEGPHDDQRTEPEDFALDRSPFESVPPNSSKGVTRTMEGESSSLHADVEMPAATLRERSKRSMLLEGGNEESDNPTKPAKDGDQSISFPEESPSTDDDSEAEIDDGEKFFPLGVDLTDNKLDPETLQQINARIPQLASTADLENALQDASAGLSEHARMLLERRYAEPNLEDRAIQYELLKRLHKTYTKVAEVELKGRSMLHNALNMEDEAWKRTLSTQIEGNLVPIGRASEQDAQNYVGNEALLDSDRYQPQGYNFHARNVGLHAEQTGRPRYPSMPYTTEFKPHQVVAISQLKIFRERGLRGALLCDRTGLGKTHEAIGYRLYELYERDEIIANHKRHDEENEGKPPLALQPAKPCVVVALPSLLEQWAEEIEFISKRFKVVKYYGDGISRLKRTHEYFNGAEDNVNLIILTTPKTLAARHGPSALKDFRLTKLKYNSAEANKVFNVISNRWDYNLAGCFGTVIVDEAHCIKSTDSHSFRAVKWLSPDFSVLATGTPYINNISDIRAYIDIIQPADPLIQATKVVNNYTDANHPYVDLDEISDLDPCCQILRPTIQYVDRCILERSSEDTALIGRRLAALYAACMIRRSYSSSLDGKVIGDDMPILKMRRGVVEYTPEQLTKYNELAAYPLKRLVRVHNNKFWMNYKHYRYLILISTWLGFEAIHEKFMTEHTVSLLARGERLFYYIIQLYCTSQGVTCPATLHEQLALLWQGAPKVRAVMDAIADIVVRDRQKVLVFATVPAQQVLMYAICKALKIQTACWHAGLSQEAKAALQRQWNSDTKAPMVLIGSYGLTSFGLNLQHLCHWAVFLDPPPSAAHGNQAVCRIYRFWQEEIVECVIFETKGTFNDRQIQTCLRKATPGALANLNDSIFGIELKADSSGWAQLEVGDWVQYQGKLMPIDSPQLPVNHGLQVHKGFDVIQAILTGQMGEAVQWEGVEDAL